MRVIRTMLVAGLLCLAAVAAGCGSDDDSSTSTSASTSGGGGAPETEKISLVQPVPGESSFFYPYLVGRELGFFEEEGIEVEYLSASEKLPLPAFVSNGDADVGLAGADETLQTMAQGGDFKVVYDEFRTAADVLSVPADSDIQDASQLEGKTVAAAGEDDKVVLRTALEIAGVDPGSVKIVSLGRAGPTTADALKSGEVDAYASGISDAAVVETVGGIELRNILPPEIADRPAASVIVTPEKLEERRDAITRFMRAWAKATYVGTANREAVKQIGCKAVPQECGNEAISEKMLDISIEARDPSPDPYGTLREEPWVNTQDQLIAAGEYEDEVDVPSIMDPSLLEDVNTFDKKDAEAAAAAWLKENGGK